jgi:hypothetical protein
MFQTFMAAISSIEFFCRRVFVRLPFAEQEKTIQKNTVAAKC